MVLFANLEKLLRNAFDSVGTGVDERRGEGLYGRPLLGLAPPPAPTGQGLRLRISG
jgi:hypothetical protein